MPQISKKQLLDQYGIDLDAGKYRIEVKDGNYKIYAVKDDTEGCPLLGMAITDTGIAGGTSRPAVQLVKQVVSDAIHSGKQVWMTVSNITETA